jgi:hypothetical protein
MMRVAVLLAAGLVVSAPANGRDPFAPPVPAAQRPETRIGLQRFELDQLRLVALLHGERAHALFEDRAGIGYLASLGTPVGPRGGTVVAIGQRALRIREPGRSKEIVLELRADGDGPP